MFGSHDREVGVRSASTGDQPQCQRRWVINICTHLLYLDLLVQEAVCTR